MSARASRGLLLLAAACGSTPDDLGDGRLWLPPALREVSGLVAVDAATVACVQDEAGVVYLVDLGGALPLRARPFGRPGDYEGIAFTGAELWVLRSDGRLLRLADRAGALAVDATFDLPDGAEYEGLCHDPVTGRLLVLPKGPLGARRRDRDRRVVLAFDPATGLVLGEPVVALELDDLVAAAAARGLALPTHTTRTGAERVRLELMGSEIAVVPGSGDLLLLAASDHLLLRVDRQGRLVGTRLLPDDLLPQPEAMTFLADGRLVVASESRGGPAVIAVVEPP